MSNLYVLVGFPCEEVYTMDGVGWDVNVVVVVGSKDLVLFGFVEFGSMLLNIECDNLCAHVWWWLCDFWVMGVMINVFDGVVHAVR